MLSDLFFNLIVIHLFSSILLSIFLLFGTVVFFVYKRSFLKACDVLQQCKPYLFFYRYILMSLTGWLLYFIFCVITY